MNTFLNFTNNDIFRTDENLVKIIVPSKWTIMFNKFFRGLHNRLTNPNHWPNFVGIGEFLMADNNLSDGLVQDGVIFSPANLAVSWPHFHLVSFSTVRVTALKVQQFK